MTRDAQTRSERWALLVIDMQNAFCHPDGSFARMTAGTPLSIAMCEEAVPGCARLRAHAHRTGAPVIYTRFVYHPDYIDGGVLVAKYPDIPRENALAAGSWDAEIVDALRPEPSDVVIDKSRYSAFHSTRLPAILTSLGVNTLVLCGVTTNICVESTARDAAQHDYHVVVVADAVGELTRERHENALAILEYGFADVLSVDAVQSGYGAA